LTTSDLLVALHKEVLEAYRKEFEQLATTFRDIDAKAQGTAVIAGGFLAAALAFVNQAGSLAAMWSRALAALAVLCLVLAIVFAISSLRIREVFGPPSGVELELMLRDVYRISDPQEVAERLPFFYSDTAELWRECVVTRRTVNMGKARLVSSAQRSLLAAAACVTLLVLSRIALA
jgi:hypothetical protein